METNKRSDLPIDQLNNDAVVERAYVRTLVEKNAKALLDAALAGENPHQLALDQADEVEKFMSKLSPDSLSKFLTLYHQELDASTQSVLDKNKESSIAAINQQTKAAVQANNVSTWIGLVVFFIVLITFIRMLKA